MDRKHPRRARLSVQMTGGMIAMVLLLVVLIYLMNRLFLSGFYLKDKQNTLKEAFTVIDEAADNTRLYTEDFKYTLEQLCANSNLSLVVVSANGTILLATQQESNGILSQLFDAFFERSLSVKEPLETTDSYTIRIQNDSRLNNEYLILSGTLSDGNLILMRSAIASMEEAAAISNRFLLLIAALVCIIGIIYAVLFTRRLTRPVYEMNELAEQMSNLNFEVKYRMRPVPNELDELGEHLNRLSRHLEETIGELKQANVDLLADIKSREENERMRQEFLSNVSHELKTPIALILGYAEGLSEHITEDPKEQQFYLDTITDEAKRMDLLVRQLLTLNELEFNAADIKLERFDIAQMAEGLLSASAIQIDQAKIDVSAPQGNVFVWGDPFRIEQVLSNYLSNAIHYAAREKKIELRFEERDKKLRIHVFNSGDPIDEEQLPQIWDKFYKADEARSREYGGSGIGLSIVKAIMESLKQEYGVTNYDNGVDFWFELDR